MLTASVLVIGAAMLVYILSRPLRTDAARCELMLLIGMFLIHFSYIWARDARGLLGGIIFFLLANGFLLTYFWTSVLTFDIWWSFRFVSLQETILN